MQAAELFAVIGLSAVAPQAGGIDESALDGQGAGEAFAEALTAALAGQAAPLIGSTQQTADRAPIGEGVSTAAKQASARPSFVEAIAQAGQQLPASSTPAAQHASLPQAQTALPAAAPETPRSEAPAPAVSGELPVQADSRKGKAVETPIHPQLGAHEAKPAVASPAAAQAPVAAQALVFALAPVAERPTVVPADRPAPTPAAPAAPAADQSLAAPSRTGLPQAVAATPQPKPEVKGPSRSEARETRSATMGEPAATDARSSSRAEARADVQAPEHGAVEQVLTTVDDAPIQIEPAADHAPEPHTAAVAERGLVHAHSMVEGRPAAQTVAHLAAHIVSRIDGKATRFDVQLEPHGLGTVDVKIEISRGGEVSAALTFDNPQAAAELRGRAGELQRALEQAGFDLSKGGLSFEMASQGDGRGAFEQAQDQRPTWRGRAFSDIAEAADQPAAPLRTRPAGRVDVTV